MEQDNRPKSSSFSGGRATEMRDIKYLHQVHTIINELASFPTYPLGT
jgi:hypothetical protein